MVMPAMIGGVESWFVDLVVIVLGQNTPYFPKLTAETVVIAGTGHTQHILAGLLLTALQ